MALTELQAQTLERRLSGDKWASRMNFMFCFSEREKYVQVWESDRRTVVSERTSNALFDKGYYYAGSVTESGVAALAAYRAKHPRTETAQKQPAASETNVNESATNGG